MSRRTDTGAGRQHLSAKHGTPSNYKLGCRCRPCTTANTSYEKKRRDDGGKPTLPVLKFSHDTLTRAEFMQHRYGRT